MRHIGLSFILFFSCIAPSRNVIKEIGQAAANLSRCSFTLDRVSDFQLAGTGHSTTIPLRMNLDLIRFFKEKGFDRILNLALAPSGTQGSASRVTLRACPTISTDFGPISDPGEIDIIDKEFRGK